MNAECRSDVQQIRDGAEAFNVTVIEANQTSKRFLLFAVGRGGNPERHLPLLRSVAALGCAVIAPHFDMLTSMVPTKKELDKRVRRLEASVAQYFKADLPIVGICHSIGTVTLLALAGGEAQTLAGETVMSGSTLKFDRLALFAPPTDFCSHCEGQSTSVSTKRPGTSATWMNFHQMSPIHIPTGANFSPP
jgi:hypothetical protein